MKRIKCLADLKVGDPYKKQRMGNGYSSHPPLPSSPHTCTLLLLPAYLTHSLLQLFLSFSIHLVAPIVPDHTNLWYQDRIGPTSIIRADHSVGPDEVRAPSPVHQPRLAGLSNSKSVLQPNCGWLGSFSENMWLWQQIPDGNMYV